jgi:hypothetical protein
MVDMRRDAANGYDKCPDEGGVEGWDALDSMVVMWKLETVPDEYIWLKFDNLSKWDTRYLKWDRNSNNPSSRMWCQGVLMTTLGGQSLRGRACVEKNPYWHYDPECDYGDVSGNAYGFPSVFPQSYSQDSVWTAETCSFVDYFAKQYNGEVDNIIVDITANVARGWAEVDDPEVFAGNLDVDVGSNIAVAYGDAWIEGEVVIPDPAVGYGQVVDPVTTPGSLIMNIEDNVAVGYAEAEATVEQVISTGYARLYGQALDPSISPSTSTFIQNLENDPAVGYGDTVDPAVYVGGDADVSPGVALAWGECDDPTYETGDTAIDIADNVATGYAEVDDPEVEQKGIDVLNPDIAVAFCTSSAGSPEFGYDLTFNTTGEEYTLGGT